MKEIGQYLEKNLTDSQVASICEFTSLKSMKNNPSFNFKLHAQEQVIDNFEFEFVKSGQIGQWRGYFSPEMSQRVDQTVKTQLKSNINIKYDGSSK